MDAASRPRGILLAVVLEALCAAACCAHQTVAAKSAQAVGPVGDGEVSRLLLSTGTPTSDRVARFAGPVALGAATLALGARLMRGSTKTTPARTVKQVKHHAVPKEVLKALPEDVARALKGRCGAPNRWPMPEDLHRAIHRGKGGGVYNVAFRRRVEALGRTPTVRDVVRIRDEIVRQFGLEQFQP